MIKHLHFYFAVFILSFYHLPAYAHTTAMLASTESDPDALVAQCVNAINGDYCKSTTDLTIVGPDLLVLQRFYNATNYVTGKQTAGWRTFSTHFLIMGKDPKADKSAKKGFERILAFTGERSGGIFKYSGWRQKDGITTDPLQIDIFENGTGMVNSYAMEMSGQTDHKNNLLHCSSQKCELVLGDGTKRIYEKVKKIPALILGEELFPYLSEQVIAPEYYRLLKEILPSGNQIFFSYNSEGHVALIEMKNAAQIKSLSWIRFNYESQKQGYLVKISTSDSKTLEYHFSKVLPSKGSEIYILTHVRGSHLILCTYEYQIKDRNCQLVKESYPQGNFIELDYDVQGRVKAIKEPDALSGNAAVSRSFVYGENYTDVFDALGTKTRYRYDQRLQLTAIENYNRQGQLCRTDKKFWGKDRENAGLLLAKATSDETGVVRSYCSYKYDSLGNVIEESLFGNLTGKEEVAISLDGEGQHIPSNGLECHRITRTYSQDGFNLLVTISNGPNSHVKYVYKNGTNLRIGDFTYESGIKNRVFHVYNEDAACVQIIEDDGYSEDQNVLGRVQDRHITSIHPKSCIPGVGLPEIIEEKVFDFSTKQEKVFKRCCNTYDASGYLLRSDTYDTEGAFAYAEQKNYNSLGQPILEINRFGQETRYTYDELGNLTSAITPHENKEFQYAYDHRNQLVSCIQVTQEGELRLTCAYDVLGQKTSITDQFRNNTCFEYDDFGRVIHVLYPQVYDENENVIQPSVHYAYDLFGNVVSMTDPNGYVTNKTYTLRNNPTKIFYPDGSEEWFKYDVGGTLIRKLSRDQILTCFQYDDKGRVTFEQTQTLGANRIGDEINTLKHEYKGFHCVEEQDCEIRTKYINDPFGRPIDILKFSGEYKESETRRTEIVYDSLSRISRKKIWFGTGQQDYSTECFEYDLAGHILDKRIEDAKGNLLLQQWFDYDANGRCIEEYGFIEGKKTTTLKTIYNSQGEPTCYIDALGNETHINSDNLYYNALGQNVMKKALTNPQGVKTEIEYDALGRVVSIIKNDPFGVLLSRQRLRYNAGGLKCCEMNDRVCNGEVIGTQLLRWKYGPMERLEEETEIFESGIERRTSYQYNSLGQTISKLMPGSPQPITYKYNSSGRLSDIQYADANKPKEHQIHFSYEYDCRGNIIRAKDILGTVIVRRFNPFGEITYESVYDGSHPGNLNHYSYDRMGRISSVKLPDKSLIQYNYDSLFSSTVKHLSSKGEVLFSHKYEEFDKCGRVLSEEIMGGKKKIEHSYDLNGKELQIKTPFYTENGAYDVFGRLNRQERKGSLKPLEASFSYSHLSQLDSEKGTINKKYLYDSFDNRLKVNDEPLIYELDRLISHSSAKYAYDPQGNLLRKTLDQEETQIETNILSQIIKVKKPDGSIVTFNYDGLGRRLLKKHEKNVSTYPFKKTLTVQSLIYIGNQEIGAIDDNIDGKIVELRIPGLSSEGISSKSVGIEIKGKPYVPLHDIVGNLIALADYASGDIVESYAYSAFSEEAIYDAHGNQIPESKVGNPWRYAEKRLDKETGLLYFGYRYYDPQVGRWVTPDPIGTLDGPNPYAYIHNNPLNCFDRLGLATESNSESFLEYFNDGEHEYYLSCSGSSLQDRYCVLCGGPVVVKGHTHQLPKVTYCNSFENRYPKNQRSKRFDLGLPETPNLGIGFINGILNSFQDALESARYLSDLAGGYNVRGVYNKSHGLLDLVESAMGLACIATLPVHLLHEMWDEFFATSSPDAMFLQICHSQGAIHVMNALLDYDPELRKRILVVAIAPAGYIYSKTCKQIVHYRAAPYRDFVPQFDQKGRIREKGTTIVLESQPGAPKFDHPFMSPTYQEAIRFRVKNYLKKGGKRI